MPFCRTLHLIDRTGKKYTVLSSKFIQSLNFWENKIWTQHNGQFLVRNALWVLNKTSKIQNSICMQTKLWRIYLPPTLKVRSNKHFFNYQLFRSEYKKGYIYFTLLTVVTLSPITRDLFSDIIFDKPSLILIESITCFESMRANVGFNRNSGKKRKHEFDGQQLSNLSGFPEYQKQVMSDSQYSSNFFFT